MFVIEGKVALVTGGAAGIGLCYAKELLCSGLKAVTLVDLDFAKGIEALDEIEKEFGPSRAIFAKADVRSNSEFEDAFILTIKTFQQLDIVINNAGIVEEADWEKCISVNLCGAMRGTLLAIEQYLPKYKSGSEAVIVNTASAIGLVPWPSVPIYSAAKAGLICFSRAFGSDEHYQKSCVKVLTLCPTATATAMAIVPDKAIRPNCLEMYREAIRDMERQDPKDVAKGLMSIIKEGKNGTVWLTQAGKPISEVELPNDITLK